MSEKCFMSLKTRVGAKNFWLKSTIWNNSKSIKNTKTFFNKLTLINSTLNAFFAPLFKDDFFAISQQNFLLLLADAAEKNLDLAFCYWCAVFVLCCCVPQTAWVGSVKSSNFTINFSFSLIVCAALEKGEKSIPRQVACSFPSNP